MEKPLVSIMIPAYNLPEYTRKTLQSIVEQEYRPIEVVLSDDCSPVSLEPLVEEFRHYESDVFTIRYYRQETNLRVDNVMFLFDRLAGKFFLYMPHDDWLTDSKFLVETVDIMESNPECYLCVANSVLEKTSEPAWPEHAPVTAEAVAAATIRAIRKGRHAIIPYGWGKVFYWLNRLSPRLVDALMARYA